MSQPAPVVIGSRRELFVDQLLIESLEDAALRLHHPQPAGVALALDAPWEGKFAFYTTVLRDGDRYLMYYRGWTEVDTGRGPAPACTCCAVSPDGIHWSRPELGLVELDGSPRNNLILHEREHGAVCHNFAPFLDARPGVPLEERFKALGGTWRDTGGLLAYASADGLRWRRWRPEPVITHPTFAFDSQNVAFWSEAEGCYVCYYRIFVQPGPGDERVRWVCRRTSHDFVHWSEPQEMRPEGGPLEQIYTQQTGPYYRAPHLYVALAARFMPGRTALTEDQARATGVDPRYAHDCSDGVLMTTRAGSHVYARTFMESFVRPGLGAEHWTSRSNYPACGLLPTGEAEMSIYVNRRYAQPGAHVERLTLRPDGLGSVHAGYGGGELITTPLIFTGRALELNYATSAAGALKVEIQDAAGLPIAGYGLAEADEVLGDELARVVAWRGNPDVGRLAGRPVRLRFALRDADLYALRFRP